MRLKTKINQPKFLGYAYILEVIFRHERIWRPRNEQGFIPMIVVLLLIIAAVVWFVFLRVNEANE